MNFNEFLSHAKKRNDDTKELSKKYKELAFC